MHATGGEERKVVGGKKDFQSTSMDNKQSNLVSDNFYLDFFSFRA